MAGKKYPSREEMLETIINSIVDAEMDDDPSETMREWLLNGLMGYKDISDEDLKKEWDEFEYDYIAEES